VCNGLDAGWDREGLIEWIDRKPAEYLGSEPGTAFIDLAIDQLCNTEGDRNG
jgi:hypothetical protein